MASEDEQIVTADVAEAAATRARNLVLALYQPGGTFDINDVADAAAEGARCGTTVASRQLPTMSSTEADTYVTAASSGAIAGTLAVIANYPIIDEGLLMEENETTVLAAFAGVQAGATVASSDDISFRLLTLAFSVGVVVLGVLVIVFRVV